MVWPNVTYETLPRHATTENMSWRAQLRAPREYESAIVPHIADAQFQQRPRTIAAVDRATIAVARFDAAAARGIGGIEQNRTADFIFEEDS